MKSIFRMVVIGFIILVFMSAGNLTQIGQVEAASDWTATFFPSTDLSGSGTVVNGITSIGFDWGANPPVVNGNPVAGITGRPYSVRFTSTQNLTPGKYVSIIMSSDGARMFINGTNVYDNFVLHGTQVDYFLYDITSNSVSATIEYFASGAGATIHFSGFYLLSEAPPEVLAILNASKPTFTDGRRNPNASASAIIYCSEKDIEIYGVHSNSEGYLAFRVTHDELEKAKNLNANQSKNVQIKSIDGEYGIISLWLLSSGKLQLHAAGLPPETYKFYDFIFDGC